MKSTHAIVCVLLIPWGGIVSAQEAASTNRVAGSGATAGAETPISVPVPVVRVPTGGAGVVETPSTEAPTSPVSAPASVSAGSGELGWSANGVGLREPTVTNVRTNRSFEIKGVVPKVTRPERRGFGGFLSGFANLFNPLAPTSKGIESRGEHWYDGSVQSAPLPRGMRDERTHEPQSALFGTDFGKGSGEDPASQAAKKEPVSSKR